MKTNWIDKRIMDTAKNMHKDFEYDRVIKQAKDDDWYEDDDE